jgi:chemotaxis signal transduction protein
VNAPVHDRLLTFEIGAYFFAVPIGGVHEVAEMVELACIPTLSRDVAGVINYRGDALPVVRRERLFAPVEGAEDESEHLLVISDRSGGPPRLGLSVDRVLGLVDCAPARARGTDPVVEKRPIDGRVAHILDPGRLVARARKVIEEAFARGE